MNKKEYFKNIVRLLLGYLKKDRASEKSEELNDQQQIAQLMNWDWCRWPDKGNVEVMWKSSK